MDAALLIALLYLYINNVLREIVRLNIDEFTRTWSFIWIIATIIMTITHPSPWNTTIVGAPKLGRASCNKIDIHSQKKKTLLNSFFGVSACHIRRTLPVPTIPIWSFQVPKTSYTSPLFVTSLGTKMVVHWLLFEKMFLLYFCELDKTWF